MSDSIIYANAFVTWNGSPMYEEASVSINKRSGFNPVYTVAKGFAGVAQGAPTCEVSIDSAIPLADFEVNPDKYLVTAQLVEIGITIAGKRTMLKMFVLEHDVSHAVNQESRQGIRLIGPLEMWES